MPDYPESGDTTEPSSIDLMQQQVGGAANDLKTENISRGALGPDVLNDSVMYCARNFSVNERVGYFSGCIIDHYAGYPETILGPHWEVDPVSSDPVLNPHQSVWHAEERRRWKVIESHSVSTLLKPPTDQTISTSITTDDWVGRNDYSTTDSYRSSFGKKLLNIPNKGTGYSLMFHTDINLAHSIDNNHSLNPREFKRWLGGQRVWTSVVYALKPSAASTRVLCWSPGHMIGASANMAMSGFQGVTGQSAAASVDITHSYTDVININNDFIERLCNARGIDFTARKMELDGTSFFGWIVVGALDRWDNIPPVEGLGSKEGNSKLKAGGGGKGYQFFQKIQVNGGSTNLIAFKDSRAGGILTPTSSLTQY